METAYLFYVLITLLFSAFFSGVEIAYISANKLQIELQKKQGLLSGKILSKFLQYPGQFIGTTLIGNTIMLVLYGTFMAFLLDEPLRAFFSQSFDNEAFILISQTVLSTILVLITGEFLPKSLFMLNPNRMLNFFALPFLTIYYLMYPIVWLTVGLSRLFITKVLRLEYSEGRPVFTITDLNSFIKDQMRQNRTPGKVEIDSKIFDNAVEFKTVKITECMVPRTDIVAVEVVDSVEELKKVFEERFSKIEGNEYFIVTNKGEQSYSVMIYRIVRKYLDLFAQTSKRSPHLLRHTFATHLLNKGADLNAVKDLLGHANLAATQVYTHNSMEKLKAVFEQAHPKA